MITKDNKDLPILEITPENYKVPAREEHFYHVKMEVTSFDQHTGERLSHPFIQKFAPIDFENGMMSILRQQGYTMVILHNPREWEKENAEKLAETKAQQEAEAKAKAKAEKEALKEELRKELLAEVTEEKKDKKVNKKKDKASAEVSTDEPELL